MSVNDLIEGGEATLSDIRIIDLANLIYDYMHRTEPWTSHTVLLDVHLEQRDQETKARYYLLADYILRKGWKKEYKSNARKD